MMIQIDIYTQNNNSFPPQKNLKQKNNKNKTKTEPKKEKNNNKKLNQLWMSMYQQTSYNTDILKLFFFQVDTQKCTPNSSRIRKRT